MIARLEHDTIHERLLKILVAPAHLQNNSDQFVLAFGGQMCGDICVGDLATRFCLFSGSPLLFVVWSRDSSFVDELCKQVFNAK
jgi:hypothetical protein